MTQLFFFRKLYMKKKTNDNIKKTYEFIIP